MAYMTYFSTSVIFFTISYNMADAVERTLDDFAKLLKTIFEEDDDLKVFQVITKVIWTVRSKFEAKN